MNHSEKKAYLKIEKFLKSDKMTHKELAHVQEMKRKRANRELNDDQYQEIVNTPNQVLTNNETNHNI